MICIVQFDEAIAALEPLPRDERTLNLLAQIVSRTTARFSFTLTHRPHV